MKKFYKLTGVVLLIAGLTVILSFQEKKDTVKYKCMIQMINYTGEKAYVVASLINPKGEYVKTLYVQGDDEEWYSDIIHWWKFSSKARENIDGITGATIGNGERQVLLFEIERSAIDAGYSIRFETAVENQEYYVKDADIPLNSAALKDKVNGTGYIRYVRMIPN